MEFRISRLKNILNIRETFAHTHIIHRNTHKHTHTGTGLVMRTRRRVVWPRVFGLYTSLIWYVTWNSHRASLVYFTLNHLFVRQRCGGYVCPSVCVYYVCMAVYDEDVTCMQKCSLPHFSPTQPKPLSSAHSVLPYIQRHTFRPVSQICKSGECVRCFFVDSLAAHHSGIANPNRSGTGSYVCRFSCTEHVKHGRWRDAPK